MIFTGAAWPRPWRLNTSAWAGLCYLGLVSMWAAFFAWYRALDWGGPLKVSQTQAVQPFFSIALAWPLLGEPPDTPTLAGAAAVVVASSSRLSAQNIAFSAVAREAIMRDPDFQNGDYYDTGRAPDTGLTIARMMAHITYLSEASMREKFGRRLQHGEEPRFAFDVDFQVESYLQHQGESFLKRFDANTYLYMTRVMDYFDAFADPAAPGANLEQSDTRFLLISFDSDWRFDTEHSREIVRHLQSWRVPVTFREIESPWGHDSFLLEIPEYDRTVAAFLDRTATDLAI
jgi:homoserine O-acetyltransferase